MLNNQTNVTIETNEVVETPYLQLMLRRGLLDKASSETIYKFTGDGMGDNSVLRESAEDIICTAMGVIKARRNNEEIIVNGTKYKVKEYKAIGSGLAKLMNWDGYSYFSDTDEDMYERTFVEVEWPSYVQDTYTNFVQGKEVEMKAKGKLVSPKKLETLIASFNGLNKKVGDENVIAVGTSVDKTWIPFSKIGYAYFGDEIKCLSHEELDFGNEMATLSKATITFQGLVIGDGAVEIPEQRLREWLW